jgi:hypothetical protein
MAAWVDAHGYPSVAGSEAWHSAGSDGREIFDNACARKAVIELTRDQ